MLNLDTSKEMTGGHIVHGRVGDNNSHIEKVSVINSDGTPFNLTGISISFMGNTHEYQTKVIDSDGVKIVDAAKGLFQYTFPSMAFGVAGPYERAYFQFTNKDGVITSTGDFEVIVLDNTDITSDEAETIITEYNKLVDELHKLQKENIAELKQQQDDYVIELAQVFGELQNNVTALEGKIKTYETNVTKTAADAQSAINMTASTAQSAIEDALDMIAEALAEFQNGDFYTKLESDNRFAKKTDLTKENVQLGNVDNYGTANQEEAESGESDEKLMTPRTTRQSIEKRSVLLAGDQDVDGKKNFLVMPTVGGKEFLTTDDFPLSDPLWSGISYLRAVNTITLTKSLSDCKSGIVLKFNPYNSESGSAYTSQTSWCFIPKHHVTTNASGQNTFCPIFKQDGTFVGAKVITVSPTTITGADVNATGALLGYVLTGVYEV